MPSLSVPDAKLLFYQVARKLALDELYPEWENIGLILECYAYAIDMAEMFESEQVYFPRKYMTTLNLALEV
jgi:hypothetical protein